MLLSDLCAIMPGRVLSRRTAKEEVSVPELIMFLTEPGALRGDVLYLLDVAEAERIDLLKELKDRLSPMESRFFELYLAGKGYQEIAKEMNISAKSADNALQRIRRKTVTLLSREDPEEKRKGQRVDP